MREHKKVGVIGYPISHSLSPRIHNYWLKQYGIDATYEAIPVKPEELEIFIHQMPEKGFAGVNVTIPHKESVFHLLEPDLHAKQIGAVNTVVVNDGKLMGMNTDAYGFIHSLLEKNSAKALRVISQNTLIIGAGGATRAVCMGLQPYAKNIILINRTREKAEKLANHMQALGMNNIIISDWSELEDAMTDVSLLVNTTSLGMKGQPPLDISLDKLPKAAVVTDIVYNPLLTPLLRQAHERGNKTVDGLGMLLYQAQNAFQIWFGENLPAEVTPELRQYVAEALQ